MFLTRLRWPGVNGKPELRPSRGVSLGEALIPGVGLGTSLALFQLELWIPAVVAVILTVGALVVARPRIFRPTGLEQRTTSAADYTRSQMIMPLAAPGVTFLAGIVLEPAGLAPWLAVPLWVLALSVTTSWALLRLQRQSLRIGNRRARAALETTGLEAATATRIDVASTLAASQLLHALRRVGAVDGIQVRLWKLAEDTGREVTELREVAVRLQRHGLVRLSMIDSGADQSRNLLELTPVGVRTMLESRRR